MYSMHYDITWKSRLHGRALGQRNPTAMPTEPMTRSQEAAHTGTVLGTPPARIAAHVVSAALFSTAEKATAHRQPSTIPITCLIVWVRDAGGRFGHTGGSR